MSLQSLYVWVKASRCMHLGAMEIKMGSRKSGISRLSKFVQIWDLQICSSYLILFFAMLVALFCFVYFDILRFAPSSAGLLLNLSAIRSFSHSTTLATRLRPSFISSLPSTHSPPPPHLLLHHHYPPRHSSADQESSESSLHENMTRPHPSIPPSNPPPNPSPLTATDLSIIGHSDNNPSINSSQSANPIDSFPESTNPIENSSQSTANPSKESAPSGSPPVGSLARKESVDENGDGGGSAPASTSPPVDSSATTESRDKNGDGGSKKEAEEEEEVGEFIYERPKRKEGECNLYEGKWVRDESYPLYRSEACPFVDGGFRCQENGRPDDDYLKWRWKPAGCDMPRFNSENMLKMLRGRRLVFVGDSIGRNQWESLLCMLATGLKDKTRIYEVNGEPITKHKGFLIFKFEAFNCTIEYYRSPFLVPQGRPPRNAPREVRCTLRVDTMDWTSKRWLGADIIVFNAGHWWSYEKTIRGGCFFQVGGNVNTSMNVKDGFVRAMQTWRRWVASNIDSLKTQTFFRTYAPVHFSGGSWKTGGRCDKETEPYEEGTKFGREAWTNGVVVAQAALLGQKVQLLDITHLAAFRKDAHSSVYHVGRDVPRPFNRQDCSHWCLPGVPDTWNELLYASLLNSDKTTTSPRS